MLKNEQVMKKKGRTTFRLFSLLLLAAICLLSAIIPLFHVLVVRDAKTNQLVWSWRVQEESPFAIRWIHSIHRSPVIEYYRVRGEHIVLIEMSFKDYGIGMNSELAPGEQLVTKDDGFHIVNMNQVFPALHLFIGQVRANHTLLFGEKEIPLASLVAPGKAVVIRVEKQSILEKIGGY
jgi:hypothetical protein